MAPITRSAARKPPKTFKFSSLPTELRLMIWRESIQPRILHITAERIVLPNPVVRRKPGQRICVRGIPTHIRFKSREKSPVTLQICRESRTLALKHYTPSFHSTTCPLTRASEVKQTALYFNAELDTVHIERANTLLYYLTYRSGKETTQSIKMLAIEDQNVLDGSARTIVEIAGNLHPLQALETLTLVVGNGMGCDGKELIRVNMEGHLVQEKDWLISQGECKEWKLPAVKVMTREDFENPS